MEIKITKNWYECKDCGFAVDVDDMLKSREGLSSICICKECYAKRKKLFYKTDYGGNYCRQMSRRFAKLHPERIKEIYKKWRQNHPEKYKELNNKRRKSFESNPNNKIKISAHSKVRYALKIKKMFKKPCEVCGDIKSQAHHPDYTEPLKVRWLCQKHHLKLHNK